MPLTLRSPQRSPLRFPLRRRLLILLPAVLLLSFNTALAGGLYAVGLRQMSTTSAPTVPLAIWYPSGPALNAPPDAAPKTDAPLAQGPFPLILLSHGSGGSEFGHADWAMYLAAHGYIVAAPRHLGDSYDQPDGRGSDVQMIGRAWQAQAALDTVLDDARLKPAIAAGRIGMIGFSAGGYTTLVMAGARPDFALWRQHCTVHAAEDAEFCPPLIWPTLPRITRPGWTLPHETRIKAAVVMAPASVFFDAKGLSAVTIPLRLYGARDDHNVVNTWNVDRVAAALPQPDSVHLVPGGHYVFLAPCAAALRAQLPAICDDAAGVDRPAIHRQIANELLAFFNEKL